jgi:serine/threonine protein phosphatase PrpC
MICRRNGKAIRLTKDHKASDPSEEERVKKAGGACFNGKLAGNIKSSLGTLYLLHYPILECFVVEFSL